MLAVRNPGNRVSDKLWSNTPKLGAYFERVINSLYEEELYDIYLTGSNAFLLSSDLATLFGGRVFEIKLYPFSFNEYLKYYPSDDVDAAFDDYVKKGGMAGSYLYKTEEDARKYINGIYRTTIKKLPIITSKSSFSILNLVTISFVIVVLYIPLIYFLASSSALYK